MLASGAHIGFSSGEPRKLMDDIQALRPTVLLSVPRLFSRIVDKVQSESKKKSELSRLLFEYGLRMKLSRLSSTGAVTHALWDALVFNKAKVLLGGRCRFMLSGSAPLDPMVRDKMKAIFCIPLVEGYGMTETTGGTLLSHPLDSASDHVGGPLGCCEVRLRVVEDMGYEVHHVTPTERNPYAYPTGELCVRGHSVSPGYFRSPQETKKVLDDQGWLHTGDIAAMLPNGAFKLVDRKKNIFKLSQGEYVAPEKIENVYAQAKLVSQIFVFGYSTESFLVGIVVPEMHAARTRLLRNEASTQTDEQVCEDERLRKAIMEELSSIGKIGGLRGFECVKDVMLTPHPFSLENDLLTPTFKLKRFTAQKVFKEQIDQMYANAKVAGLPV